MRKQKIASDTHYFKFMAEGCKTFDEILKALDSQKSIIRFLKKLECKMEQEVDNGFLMYIVPKKSIKQYCKEFGMVEEDLYPCDEEECE